MNKYRMCAKDRIAFTVLYILMSAALAWLFYDVWYVTLAFAPFFPLYIMAVRKLKGRKRDEELTDEFMKALISVSTSLAAGISPENAFTFAGEDMEKLYGRRSPIAAEMGIINSQVAMGQRLSDALYDLAKRTQIPEIYDFAVVFSVAGEKGADFPSIISSCVSIMDDKRRAECEAKVMIRAKQYEQRLMSIIPAGILLYLRFSSGGFIGVLYHNAFGIVIMTVCLAVYVLAVYLSERIGDVRV